MQNRAKSLSSYIENLQMLKLNYDRLTDCGSKSSHVDDGNGLSCPIDSEVRHGVFNHNSFYLAGDPIDWTTVIGVSWSHHWAIPSWLCVMLCIHLTCILGILSLVVTLSFVFLCGSCTWLWNNWVYGVQMNFLGCWSKVHNIAIFQFLSRLLNEKWAVAYLSAKYGSIILAFYTTSKLVF